MSKEHKKIIQSPLTPTDRKIHRRRFLQIAAAGMGSVMLTKCAASRQKPHSSRPLRELSPTEIRDLLAGMEKDLTAQYSKPTRLRADPALPDVQFGYGLDLSRCIGCRRCVYACVAENNQSRDPQIQWIRVLRMPKEGGVDIMDSTAYYNPPLVPEDDFFYMPVACQQCKNPPCVKVCPVQATWQEADGITVIDADWCIGCRYCMAACPYGARHFNWAKPGLTKKDYFPDLHILGNRPRPAGVVEKCHFCLHRTRAGRYPACVEACPVGARKFGNLLDPGSEMRYILKNKRVFIFKEELSTRPRFYYFYGT
jgi:Fe-S-cluster-containing dehydrogenase component